jgi:hypothetical protein
LGNPSKGVLTLSSLPSFNRAVREFFGCRSVLNPRKFTLARPSKSAGPPSQLRPLAVSMKRTETVDRLLAERYWPNGLRMRSGRFDEKVTVRSSRKV